MIVCNSAILFSQLYWIEFLSKLFQRFFLYIETDIFTVCSGRICQLEFVWQIEHSLTTMIQQGRLIIFLILKD